MSPRTQTHSQCVVMARMARRSRCWSKVQLGGHTPSLSLSNGTNVFWLHGDIRKRRATRIMETSMRVFEARLDPYRTANLKMSASRPPSRRSVQRALCTTRAEFDVSLVPGSEITPSRNGKQQFNFEKVVSAVQIIWCPRGVAATTNNPC